MHFACGSAFLIFSKELLVYRFVNSFAQPVIHYQPLAKALFEFLTWAHSIKAWPMLNRNSTAQSWKKFWIGTGALPGSRSNATCFWTCTPKAPRSEELIVILVCSWDQSCFKNCHNRYRHSDEVKISIHSTEENIVLERMTWCKVICPCYT